MKIGIFGGTFNPPHNTHVTLAQQAVSQLGLQKLVVVPCGIPPHKNTEIDGETRLHLAQLAFGSFAEVSDCEISKQGKSYTVETLQLLKQRFADDQLFLIIGGDSFQNFHKWYKPQEIASLCTLAVAGRSRKTSQATARRIARQTGAQAVFLDVQPNDVSSTEIRLRYQFGLDNSAFVCREVNDFVLQHNLYAKFRPIAQKLSTYLTKQRFLHTFYVVKRGLELATDDEKDKVFLACLLHDCAKYVNPQRYAYYGFEKPKNMPEPVVHSFLGALVAQKDFGINDVDVLDAIKFHTTGCPNMTRLQKIVYVADKTEETRPYPLSHLITGSLDCQLKKCLLEANAYTTEAHGENLYPLSQQTLDFYFPKSAN